jgi:hypothetical protein
VTTAIRPSHRGGMQEYSTISVKAKAEFFTE